MMFIEPKDRSPTSCSCDTCKAMCRRSPCMPTPADVRALERAGYGQHLKASTYIDVGAGMIPYVAVMPRSTEAGCIFLDCNGLCVLHDQGLKPTEGRLAHHSGPDNGLRVSIARTWYNQEGLETLLPYHPDKLDLLIFKTHFRTR